MLPSDTSQSVHHLHRAPTDIHVSDGYESNLEKEKSTKDITGAAVGFER